MKLKTSAQTAPKTVQSSGLYGLVSFVLVSRVLAWRALGFRNMRCRVEGLGWAQGLILEVVGSGILGFRVQKFGPGASEVPSR